jgi:hypothetical protein
MHTKTMKLTPTFPPDIKPVHFGIYEVTAIEDNGDVMYGFARFDGVWGCLYPTLWEAEHKPMDAFYASQSKYWRGILQQ